MYGSQETSSARAFGVDIPSSSTIERPAVDLRRQRALRSLAAIAVFLGLWQVMSVTGLFGKYPPELMRLFLPSPGTIIKTTHDLLVAGSLFHHISTSVYRVLLGFLVSVVVGLPCGLAMGLSPVCEDALTPFVRLLQPIPGVAWVPLAIIWLGLGNRSAIFIIAVGSLFPILLNTRQGVLDVDPALVDAALTLGASRKQVILNVILPSLLPHLITGFRLGTGFAWRVVLAAEMVGVSQGLGYMLTLGRGVGRTDITIVTMLAIGVLMMVTDSLLFARLEAWASRHRSKMGEGGDRGV